MLQSSRPAPSDCWKVQVVGGQWHVQMWCVRYVGPRNPNIYKTLVGHAYLLWEKILHWSWLLLLGWAQDFFLWTNVLSSNAQSWENIGTSCAPWKWLCMHTLYAKEDACKVVQSCYPEGCVFFMSIMFSLGRKRRLHTCIWSWHSHWDGTWSLHCKESAHQVVLSWLSEVMIVFEQCVGPHT